MRFREFRCHYYLSSGISGQVKKEECGNYCKESGMCAIDDKPCDNRLVEIIEIPDKPKNTRRSHDE